MRDSVVIPRHSAILRQGSSASDGRAGVESYAREDENISPTWYKGSGYAAVNRHLAAESHGP